MNPCIGDRQLEPDDDSYKCQYCGFLASGQNSLRAHVQRCPHNDDIEPEDDE